MKTWAKSLLLGLAVLNCDVIAPRRIAMAGGAEEGANPAPAIVKESGNESANFLRDVAPLFSKLGCNAIACHGSTSGRGGFKLSMFGADPQADYEALTRMHMGRRINRVEPARSLVLLKATGKIAHTGGTPIQPDSSEYAMLTAWIARGVPRGDDQQDQPVALTISPEDKVLSKGDGQQLLVQAVYADGSQRDVTRLASFASSDPGTAAVGPGGAIQAEGFGEAVVTATFMRRSEILRVLVPQPLPTPFPTIEPNNRIDELVFAKLQKLGFPPSELCSDEDFLRRVYLDVIGTLPTADEARAFLADPDPARRSKVIDGLLQREEYADFWALKWGDLLRIKSEYPVRVWPRGVKTYYRWVRDSVAADKPYDQFVRELLTANGSDFLVGPANYYRAVQKREPLNYAETTAVLFLGARLDCAHCHAHPTEHWDQDDGLGMAAFFSKVAVKATQEWKEEIVYFNRHGAVWHPKRRDYVNPKFLDGEVLDLPRDQDPRPVFAEWLTAPQNPWFARVMANRVWYWLLGRGIVHEPDDFRSTNPPGNPELLDYLAQEFTSQKFDVKHLFRLILNSKTYQLSSKPNEFNRADVAHFSHYHVRRMGAEQLLDAVCQVTGTTDQFASWIPVPPTIMPAGSRAIQVFDGDIKNPLLDLFGRPPRDTPYECERNLEGSVRQSLHLVNSDHFEGKVAGSPKLQQLLQPDKTDSQIVDELYLATLSRLPGPEERQKFVDYLAGAGKTVPPQLEIDKKTAEEALARAQADLQQAGAAYDAAEKAAQEAEAAAAAATEAANQTTAAHAGAEKVAGDKRRQAADAKKAVDEAQNALAAAQQKQQQSQTDAGAANEDPAKAENEKKAAEEALTTLQQQVDAATQVLAAAESAAKEAETALSQAKSAAESAKASQTAAAAAAADKRKLATDALAVRDQLAGDEKAAAARLAEVTQKLAEATAALKPPRHQAFQDLLWALCNTKEFLFNH